MTDLQRAAVRDVWISHRKGRWYRASGSGQRVTLASLSRPGILERRAYRGKEGEASAAFEYQLGDVMRTRMELKPLPR